MTFEDAAVGGRERVLVTGGGGFLGSHLVRALLSRGHIVRVLGRNEYPALSRIGVECLRGDVSDADTVERATRGAESVFHVAARVGYWGRRIEYVRTNLGGTRNVIEACRKAGVGRLVYTSTPSVVIGTKGGLEGADETLAYPDRHLYAYAETKARAEELVLASNERDGLSTVAIRPHFIFGPGDPQIVPRLIENAKRGTLVRIGDGRNKVDVTYIDNAVSAHILAHEALAKRPSPVGGQAYFIGQEAPVVLWDFIDEVLAGFGAPRASKHISVGAARVLGGLVECVFRTLRLRGEPPITRSVAVIMGTSHYFSHAKAARDFGYAPHVTTAEGLRRVLESISKVD